MRRVTFCWTGLLLALSVVAPFPSKCPQFDKASDTDFSVVSQMPTFIDKTLLLEYVRNRPATSRVYLAPRRFGKSTNLDMMHKFFQATVDENGNTLPQESTKNYALFDRLKIGKCNNGSFMKEHYGKYPVIRLDLSQTTLDHSGNETLQSMMRNLFSTHSYLSSSQEPFVAKTFTSIHNEVMDSSKPFISSHMELLTQLLHTHFGRKVIVLVDEFGHPEMSAALGPEKFGLAQEIRLDNLRDFLRIVVRNNDDVLFSFITGITRVGGTLNLDLNNLDYKSIFDDAIIAQFYGFTDEDVQRKAKELGRSALIKDMKEMYDGYIVRNSNVTLYNTQSVVKCFATGRVQPFWEAAAGLAHLKSLLQFKRFGAEVEAAIHAPIRVTLKNKISSEDLKNFSNMIDGTSLLSKWQQRNLFFQYLLEQGYFTIVKVISVYENVVEIGVPNKEISDGLQQLIDENKKKINEQT